MLRKIFILVLVIFAISYLQKNNPAIKKILISKNVEKTKSSKIIITPTNLIEKTVNKQKKIFLQVDEPKNNLTVNDPIININGKTIPNANVFINDQELKADTNGRFTSATTLEEGENYILIVTSDDLGNSAEKDILINLETKQ